MIFLQAFSAKTKTSKAQIYILITIIGYLALTVDNKSGVVSPITEGNQLPHETISSLKYRQT